MLNFSGKWRFEAPPAGNDITDRAVSDLMGLINRVARPGDRWDILEHFKTYFAHAAGSSDNKSSSESWAETDLHRLMHEAAENPPLFIEAFYDACEALRGQGVAVPDVDRMNRTLAENDIKFRIEPPNLTSLAENDQLVIEVPERPPTLAEQAIVVYQQSLTQSATLLAAGQDREAVQEILWLLESVSTAFRGVETDSGTIGGAYFNQIVRELRDHAGRGTTLEQILNWMTTMHGYLSAPAGGGVRHGRDLNRGVAISHDEARLYCNLVRSYIGFLLSEHERLTARRPR